jgi:hypothetical protein
LPVMPLARAQWRGEDNRMNYNPSPDRSGEIMMNGMNNAALYNLQGMQSIGDSLRMVAKSYADNAKTKAEGRAFKQVFGVVAPAMGVNEEQLKQITAGLKNDNDWAEFGRQQTGSIGSMIQFGMYGPNGTARQGQARGSGRMQTIVTDQGIFGIGPDGAPVPLTHNGQMLTRGSGEGGGSGFNPLGTDGGGLGVMPTDQGAKTQATFPHGSTWRQGGKLYRSINGTMQEVSDAMAPSAQAPTFAAAQPQSPATPPMISAPVPVAAPAPLQVASPPLSPKEEWQSMVPKERWAEWDAMTPEERSKQLAVFKTGQAITDSAKWGGRAVANVFSAIADGTQLKTRTFNGL